MTRPLRQASAPAVGALSFAVAGLPIVLILLAPEMAHTVGFSTSLVIAFVMLFQAVAALAAIPLVEDAVRHHRRGLLAVLGAAVCSLVVLGASLATASWQLAIACAAAGALSSTSLAYHAPLAAGTHPDEWLRRLAVLQVFRALARVAPSVLVAAVIIQAGLTWRAALLAAGLLGLLGAVGGSYLREPEVPAGGAGRITRLGFAEGTARLMAIAPVKRTLGAFIAIGLLTGTVQVYMLGELIDRWQLGLGTRSLALAGIEAAGVVGVVVVTRSAADAAARVGRAVRLLLAVAAALALGALAPVPAVAVIAWALAAAAAAPLFPLITAATFEHAPAELRTNLAALQGIAMTAGGGVAGIVVIAGIAGQYGAVAGTILVALAALVAARRLQGVAPAFAAAEEPAGSTAIAAAIRLPVAAGDGHTPMLVCRNVDFAYGQVQVLFGVDFSVDEGEMVALLGTNGAGKSTLLKAISGVGLPSGGGIAFDGEDVTFMNSRRRVQRGISQMPGGRAVFGSLSVAENLRLFGYTLGGNRREVDRGIEESFAMFPRLAERRNQKASTLSGGEQQMLGLSQVLILRPRLVCIDELSLGLAPKVVGQLMSMVRTINQRGTAVVLVEQSVNIALRLVQHAYFMERGEVRFDGRARDLIERPDLLRSVFLQGAGAGR